MDAETKNEKIREQEKKDWEEVEWEREEEEEEVEEGGGDLGCLAMKLCGVVAFSLLVGAVLLFCASVLFARTRGFSSPPPPYDIAVRAEHREEGWLTVLWEAGDKQAVGHVVERWNPLVGMWMEVEDSPTGKQGVRDRNLPGGSGEVVRYRISAMGRDGRLGGVGETWVRMAGWDSGGRGEEFFLATSERAGRKPREVEVMDMSREEEERRLLVKWEAGEEKALGYALFVWCYASRRYEAVESYEGFRRSSKVEVTSRGPHCFVVKERSWGDVGYSPPSSPSCIYVQHWAYEEVPSARNWQLPSVHVPEVPLAAPPASTMQEVDRGLAPHFHPHQA